MKSPVLRAAAAVSVVVIGAAGFFLATRDGGSHDHHGPALAGFTDFTAQGAAWPPQMEGIESVRAVASEPPEADETIGVGDLLESEDVREALGERFVVSGEGMSAGETGRSVFLSHDHDTTVEVVTTDRSVGRRGGRHRRCAGATDSSTSVGRATEHARGRTPSVPGNGSSRSRHVSVVTRPYERVIESHLPLSIVLGDST